MSHDKCDKRKQQTPIVFLLSNVLRWLKSDTTPVSLVPRALLSMHNSLEELRGEERVAKSLSLLFRREKIYNDVHIFAFVLDTAVQNHWISSLKEVLDGEVVKDLATRAL